MINGQPIVIDNNYKVEYEHMLCHLQLTDGDIEQIVRLVERGVAVTRNAMQGSDYLSVSWSFAPARGGEAEEDQEEDQEDAPEAIKGIVGGPFDFGYGTTT